MVRHRVEVDRLEHLAPEALEAAGEVADGQAQEGAGVERAAARDELAVPGPVARAAAGDPARAEHQIVLLGEPQEVVERRLGDG